MKTFLRTFIACLLGLCLGLCLAGCAPRPAPLVGTWTGTLSSSLMPGTTFPATATFRADGTDSFSSGTGLLQIEFQGHYAQAGDTLTLTPATGEQRVYTVAFAGDMLTMTDKDGGAVLTLRRAAPPDPA